MTKTVYNYESQMVRALAAILDSANKPEEKHDRAVFNAITESALLHCKQVADIICNFGYDRHERLGDFLPDFKPSNWLDVYRVASDYREAVTSRIWEPNLVRADSGDYSKMLDDYYAALLPAIAEIDAEFAKRESIVSDTVLPEHD